MSKTKKVHKPQWTIKENAIPTFNVNGSDFDPSENPLVNQHWNELLNRILAGETPTRDDFFLCLAVIREHTDGYQINDLLSQIDEIGDERDELQRQVDELEHENEALRDEISTLTKDDSSSNFADFAKDAIK